MIDKTLVNACKDDFAYLFQLQESGVTNMFGAVPYLMKRGMGRQKATDILSHWMDNYEEIAKELGIDI